MLVNVVVCTVEFPVVGNTHLGFYVIEFVICSDSMIIHFKI